MKKTVLLFGAFILLSSLVNAQDPATIKNEIKTINKQEAALKKEKKEEKKALRKLEGKEVSFTSKQHFATYFPDVTDAKWERSDYFDEATFTKDGKAMVAFYDQKGILVGTTAKISFAELPEKGQKYIKEKYKDYGIGTVIFFDDNQFNETDMLLYGSQFADEDNYFVELSKNNTKTIVRVVPNGQVFYFTEIK